jgi:hypothetical protein
MKKTLTYLISILLIAGCSTVRPPNIPVSGGGSTLAASETAAAQTSTAQSGQTSTAVAATAGAGSVLLTPQPIATITPGVVATDTPAATNTSAPVVVGTAVPSATAAVATPAQTSAVPMPDQSTPIQFAQNATTAVVNTTLDKSMATAYQVTAQAGQQMFITIDGNASFTLYDPNRAAMNGLQQALNPVKFDLPINGPYTIALFGTGPVTMSLFIPPAGTTSDTAAPIPTTFAPIQFAPGATSDTFTPNLPYGAPFAYSIQAQAGQQITVTTSGGVIPFLFDPNRKEVYSAQAPIHQWIFAPLTLTNTYIMVLEGSGSSTVTVSIPPLNVPSTGGTPIPLPGAPTRVTFAPGNASYSLSVPLTAGQPRSYIINVQAGQTLYVSTTGSVDVTIYGPGNNVLASGHSNFPDRWSVNAATTGDYTFVIAGSGTSNLTFYVPPK